MPLNLTPQSANPAQPAGPAKFTPGHRGVSMNGNTAPVPGADQVPTQVGLGAVQQAPAEQQDTGSEEGAQGAEAQDEGKGDLAWRLGLVAKKDRAARERLQAAKEAEARLKSIQEQIDQREAAIKAEEERRATWRRDPATLLRDHGFVPEAALQFMLNGEKLTPEQQLAVTLEDRLEQERKARDTEIARLRQEQDERLRKQQEEDELRQRQQLTEQEQVAVQETQADIGAIIESDPDAFPIVAAAGQNGVAAVYQRVQEMWQAEAERTGRTPPLTTKMLERAVAEVEKAARDEYRSKLQDPKIAEALGLARGNAPVRQPTLTNRMAAPGAGTQGGQQRQETEAEKRARVIRQLDALRGRR